MLDENGHSILFFCQISAVSDFLFGKLEIEDLNPIEPSCFCGFNEKSQPSWEKTHER